MREAGQTPCYLITMHTICFALVQKQYRADHGSKLAGLITLS